MGAEPDVVVEVVRSGFREGEHRGSVVALAADGAPVWVAGDVDSPVFPRSSNKPFQAAAMLRLGLDLDGQLLALAAASHSGEDFHVDGVRRILAGAGLDEQALRCPPDYPIGDAALEAYLRSGGERARIRMNCSGKHAAMLATCVVNGWPTETYREPDHPLQQGIRSTLEELTGEPVAATGIDGCGAPVLAVSLRAVAHGFGRMVTAEPGSPERRVADAMRAHPEWVGGTGREVTDLMTGVVGLLAKDGAEGVYAAALPDGRSVALKVHDGGGRARGPLMVAALRRLGVQAPVLDGLAEDPLRGGGEIVGSVRVIPSHVR